MISDTNIIAKTTLVIGMNDALVIAQMQELLQLLFAHYISSDKFLTL